MRKIASILLSAVILFSFAACGKEKTESSTPSVDLEYYAKLGSIPDCPYKLGQNIDELKSTLETDEKEAVEAGGDYVYQVTEGELSVQINNGSYISSDMIDGNFIKDGHQINSPVKDKFRAVFYNNDPVFDIKNHSDNPHLNIKSNASNFEFRSIYDYIKQGKDVSATLWQNTIKDLKCDCFILGCTELSILKEKLNLKDNFIDPLEIEADKILDFFGKERK